MINRQVVGTIHSPGALRHALRLKPGAVDALEVRADHFVENMEMLRQAIPRLGFPLILTVRHPDEGGAAKISLRQRLEIYREFLPAAAFVDLELRSVGRMGELMKEARARGAVVIVSDHCFRRTPPVSILHRRLAAAYAAGAEMAKVACRTVNAADLARLLGLFAQSKGRPLSVMGMGPMGKVSRLLCARLGSVLNYGYLDQPQVPGQWSAPLLKERVAELLNEA